MNFVIDPSFTNFYSRKFNFWGRGLFTSRACDAFSLNIKPGFDQDTLPAYFRKSNPSKAVLLVLTGLSRCKCHPSVSGSRGGKQMRGRRAGKNKRLNVRVGHKNQPKRGTYEKYTPKEKAKTSCYAWYQATIRPRHASRNFAAITKFLTRKLKNFANFECFTKFLCLENLELQYTSLM